MNGTDVSKLVDYGHVRAQLSQIMNYETVVAASNTFTINFANQQIKNVKMAIPYDIIQVETATAAGTVTANPGGNATVTITSAGMAGSPKAISVAVLLNDDANAIATKIRAALTADGAVNGKFVVGGANATISLTNRVAAADDTTLNIAIATGTATGVTAVPTSVHTTAGGVVAKAIVASNVPTQSELFIELLATAPAVITWFNGITWLNSPFLEAGKTIRIALFTSNGGTTWQGTSVGGW